MNCVTLEWSFFNVWPDGGRMGRVTSGVVRGMGVAQFVRVEREDKFQSADNMTISVWS